MGGPKPRRRTCRPGSREAASRTHRGTTWSSSVAATRDLATAPLVGGSEAVRGMLFARGIVLVGPISNLELRTEESRVDQAAHKIQTAAQCVSRKARPAAEISGTGRGVTSESAFFGRPRRGADGTTLSRGASRRTRDARFASFAKRPRDSEARARSDANAPSHRLLERGARFARKGPF